MYKTKYELLYGVTVDRFPNEKENVSNKLQLALGRRMDYELKKPLSYEEECELHEINQAIRWCTKILKDIGE